MQMQTSTPPYQLTMKNIMIIITRKYMHLEIVDGQVVNLVDGQVKIVDGDVRFGDSEYSGHRP